MAPKGKGLAAEGGERKTCLGILFAHYVRQQTKDKKTQVFAQGPKCYGVSWEVKKKKKIVLTQLSLVSLVSLSPRSSKIERKE